MSSHSIAETKDKLSELISRAEKGEEITITRHGRPVVRFTPISAPAGRMTDADLDWIAKRRVGRGRPKENAGEFVSRMRDEDWAR
ncbi:MAG TPA: type II toxin-antitoxin system prevent-host-death family antitoxin [Rhizomicrobium sp.]|nr:type II toxin-antitoxin system prevent-host-death family antitoxin [Rhizomicrobium sp.]